MTQTSETSTIDAPVTKPSVTVADFDKLVDQMRVAYDEEEAAAAVKADATKKVKGLEAQCITFLEELGRTNFQTPFGTPSIVNNWKVKNPEDNSAKKMFFDFLRERGGEELVLKYMTVNNNSLNSFYKKEAKEAEKKGELLSIPGIGAPSLHKSLRWSSKGNKADET